MSENTYTLIRRAGPNGHHFWRGPNGALIIGDHSADDMGGQPTSPERCEDGALTVIGVHDSLSSTLTVVDCNGDRSWVRCSPQTFAYAVRQLSAPAQFLHNGDVVRETYYNDGEQPALALLRLRQALRTLASIGDSLTDSHPAFLALQEYPGLLD